MLWFLEDPGIALEEYPLDTMTPGTRRYEDLTAPEVLEVLADLAEDFGPLMIYPHPDGFIDHLGEPVYIVTAG